MIGRKVTRYDKDILNALKSKYTSYVKIDFDILNEPCIFFEYMGPWEMVYKLSASGRYYRNINFYCTQINAAITDFIKERNSLIFRRKMNDITHGDHIEDIKIQQETFKNVGFRDTLPSD